MGSTKDKVKSADRAGVYQLVCPYPNCYATYIGETRRSLSVRAGEHIACITKKHIELNAIAEHAWEFGHTNIDKTHFRLLYSTDHRHRLKVYESIQIHKNIQHVINRDNGSVPNSCLYDLL